MEPYEEEVQSWYAHQLVPKPAELLRVAVAITYWVEALLPGAVFAKCAAARTASPAICDWCGLGGAFPPLSAHTPPKIPDDGFPAGVPAPLQKYVPTETPWQYCVMEFNQALPPTPLRKFCTIVASPDGSLLFHCDPHNTRYTFGAVSTPTPAVPPL